MSLADQQAKYEVNIVRTGDGAAQATQELQNFSGTVQDLNKYLASSADDLKKMLDEFDATEKKAAAAAQATAAAAAAAKANSAALTEVRAASMVAGQGMREVSSLAMLMASTHLPGLANAIGATRAAMLGARSMSILTGASLSSLLPVLGGVGLALGGGLLAWSAYSNAMKDAEEQTKKSAQALEQMPALVAKISALQKAGIISPDQGAAWLGALGRQNPGAAPAVFSPRMAMQIGAAPTVNAQPPPGGIAPGALGLVTPSSMSQVQAEMQKAGLLDTNNAVNPEYEALARLRALQQQVHIETLDGIAKENAEATKAYEDRIAQIKELAAIAGQKFSDDQKAQLEADAGQAYMERQDVIRKRANAEAERAALKEIEDEVTTYQVENSDKRDGVAEEEFNIRMAGYRSLLAQGTITEEQLTQLTIEAEKKRQEGITAEQRAAEANRRAQEEADRQAVQENVKQFEQDLTVKALQSTDDRITIAKKEYDARVEYYQLLYDTGQLTEDQLTDYMQQAQIKRLQATQRVERLHILSIEEMETQAAQGFAQGFSQAFVEFANGTKSADQAFRDFAVNFLSQVAQMIMQTLILKAIQTTLFGGGGTAFAANGGIYPTMAANGLEGVSSVSSPTYFPKFNVIAGEAGREMLTVLARPRMMDVGGLQAVVGKTGNNTLAITNANALAASRGLGGAGGHLVIEIQHSDQAKAQIINQAIQGAEVRIVQRAGQSSPVREAIKRAAA